MGFIKETKSYPSHFFDGGNGADPFECIIGLARQIDPSINSSLLHKIHYDVVDIFTGKTSVFRRNVLPYHTLRHTMMVTLASIRFMHGLFLKGNPIDSYTLLRGMLCAYFHDIGMLVQTHETAHNPFQYISVHEKRSADFLIAYITQNDLPPILANEVDIIIGYTRLSTEPENYSSHSREAQMLGQLLGAADLLAQMGDRYYLELLPSLFGELANGQLAIYNNVIELMHNTIFFYHDTVLTRLFTSYIDVIDAMRLHFAVYHGIDRNLYLEAINKNMFYLKKVLAQSTSEFPENLLRRKVPKLT